MGVAVQTGKQARFRGGLVSVRVICELCAAVGLGALSSIGTVPDRRPGPGAAVGTCVALR